MSRYSAAPIDTYGEHRLYFIRSMELAKVSARGITGAERSIDMKLRVADLKEFGLRLGDLATLPDRRLERRCLISVPGFYRHRSGEARLDPTRSTAARTDLMRHFVADLSDEGWAVRLTEDSPSYTFLAIDSHTVVLFNFLNEPSGPFMVDEEDETRHYLEHFQTHWDASLPASHVESLYALSDAEAGAVGPSITVASEEVWRQLIARLAAAPERLRSMDSRDYEELIAHLLEKEGLDVTLTPSTRDGGRDILAVHESFLGRHLYLVECKRHSSHRPVGVGVVRQLFGVVMHERATAGLIVTTSSFSREAIAFAGAVEHQIALRDYEALRGWLSVYLHTP